MALQAKAKAKAANKGKVLKGGKTAKAKAAKGKNSPSGKAAGKAAGKSKRAKNGSIAHQSAFSRKNWAKRLVWKGTKVKTSTGLAKRDLCVSKRGGIVSKRKSSIAKSRYVSNHLDLWTTSLMQAREQHGAVGFVLCKKAGTKLQNGIFTSARELWDRAVAHRTSKTTGQNTPVTSLPSPSYAIVEGKLKSEDATDGLRPGDRVQARENGDLSGLVGVVERFQLGRVCVNFSGELKAVKPEFLQKV